MALGQEDLLTSLGYHQHVLIWGFVEDYFNFIFQNEIKEIKEKKVRAWVFEHGCTEGQTLNRVPVNLHNLSIT